MPTVSLRTNANALATRQRLRGKTVDAALKARARLWGETVQKNAVSLSQGPIKTAQLRGYSPGLYSTARAANPYFDAQINAQSGVFAASWRVRVWSIGDKLTITVLNVAPYAGYMTGTDKMRRRDILGRATGQIRPLSLALLDAKRQAERSVGGSLLLELAQVTLTVGVAYGGAGAG